jgi:hypothetical protein
MPGVLAGLDQFAPQAVEGGRTPPRRERCSNNRTRTRWGPRVPLRDHYLEVLVRKPGAFPGSTALEQARSAGKFTPVHDAWWAQAQKVHGEWDGTRALIEVLLLGRHLPPSTPSPAVSGSRRASRSA